MVLNRITPAHLGTWLFAKSADWQVGLRLPKETFLTSPTRTALERANLAHFSPTGFLEKREIVQVRLIGRQS
jgi:hypothetical protein